MDKSLTTSFLVLMLVLGAASGLIMHSVTGIVVGANMDVGFQILRQHLISVAASVVAFALAITLPRYWNFRALGRALAVSYLAYVVIFALILLPLGIGISKVTITEDPTLWFSFTHFWGLYLFFFLGKLFIALAVMYGWALAIYCNSFREACWLFMFLGIAFALGLALGMGIYMVLIDLMLMQGASAAAVLAVTSAVVTAAIWWVTKRIPEANDLPITETVPRERQGIWSYLILPLSIILASLGSISTIVKLAYDASVFSHLAHEMAGDFLLKVMVAHNVVGIGAIVIAVGLAFYLRSRLVRAWTVSSGLLIGVGLVLVIAWLVTANEEYGLVLGGTANVFLNSLVIPLFSVLGAITYCTLPKRDRWYALALVQLLLYPLLKVAFSKGTGLLLVNGVPLLVPVTILAVATLVSVALLARRLQRVR